MSIEQVRAYLAQYGMADEILELPVSSATVELAASALQTEPARIAKTLSFSVAAQPILLVTAGDRKIDNAKFKAQFHEKAKMLPAEQVEALVGHAIGGVCPFAVRSGVLVYLDVSLRRFDAVYPACGSANSAIRLTIEQLARLSGFTAWVDVCKPFANE